MARFTSLITPQSINLFVWGALSLSLTISGPNIVSAKDLCTDWVGKVVSVEGVVEARRVAQTTWAPTKVGETFCPGDKLRVETWRAAIVLANDTIIRLDQGTTITFTEIENKESSWLELLEGIVHFLSRVPHTLTITTPFVNATVEGTEFVIRVDANETNVWVLEGSVRVENSLGRLLLEGGEAAVARAGEGPKRQINVKPRDAVQWALYYPPLLDVSKEASIGPNQGIYQQSLSHYQAGDIQQALDQLNTIPLEQREPQFWGTRAGLLLAVGQIEKATMDIDEALRQEPNDGTALALKSIVALVNNNKEDALQLANQSVTHSPESSVGHVAKSYAQQAHFDIEEALASAQQTTAHSPKDALAWARVAELQLSLGNLSEANVAAEQAVKLNPRLARTQTILGFALLTEAKIADARKTFEQAIVLDQADPLPRLGLGLTKIQKSQLAEGRRDIEIAASLDPNNAIIRSYLGKAYFEEKWDSTPIDPNTELTWADLHNDTKQNQRAAAQLHMAKELDPHDPTPYFYDAIRKQTVNRPVEALQDLQKSIELNDNRAVYRSKLLLHDDKAARSASLGRIYQDLGFHQRALVEGWDAVSAAPNEHAAHRLLADSYASRFRHDVARVSELLQSQLLQPINFNNLQAQLSELNLQILEGTGPSTPSFNEFNPMFLRDRFSLTGNLLVGNRDTFANDLVVSGILADPVSISLGQFHYQTDGFRPNNDLIHDIYNVFLQGKITPKISLQTEYRRRKTERGDLLLNFDPNKFQSKLRQSEDQKTTRIGGRFSPTGNFDFLASLLYSKQDGVTDDSEAFFDRNGSPVMIHIDTEIKTLQGEGQFLLRHRLFNTVIGGGAYKVSTDRQLFRNLTPGAPNNKRDHHENVYIYFNSNLQENFRLTAGLTFDHVENETFLFDRNQLSPKVGVQWNIQKWLRLRMAYFQTMRHLGLIRQTIEPTQVAGFNQFFDDSNSSRATRYGVALDTKISKTLFSGIEITHREFKTRALDNVLDRATNQRTLVPISLGHRETNYQGYVFWTPIPSLALSSAFEWLNLFRPERLADRNGISKVKTFIVPLNVKYFDPRGLFLGIGGTFVRQKIGPSDNYTFTRSKDSFFLVDASLGYRFPKRSGMFMIQALNLFDQNFLYQDTKILVDQPSQPRFAPDRTILAKLTIALN